MNDSERRKPKRRKPVSDAEKMAVELSKIIFSVELSCKFRVENDKLMFSESAKSFHAEKCTWQSEKMRPCHCRKSDLQFEAYLPDRKYLTRFTARCSTCYDGTASGVHLYCAYCDEVLTGSIAGSGGKITDHLITIRHVYQQARVLQGILENGTPRDEDLVRANEYVSKLEEWSDRIRYPVHNSIRRIHFEELLRDFHRLLGRPAHQVRFHSRSGFSSSFLEPRDRLCSAEMQPHTEKEERFISATPDSSRSECPS
jgi:hypothetical protein